MRARSIEDAMSTLHLDPKVEGQILDQRITMGARTMQVRINCLILSDNLYILSDAKTKCGGIPPDVTVLGKPLIAFAESCFRTCAAIIAECWDGVLPKIAVEASLYYARIARQFQSSGILDESIRSMAQGHHEKAKALLDQASTLCKKGFRGADAYSAAVDESMKSLRKEWYEVVTYEEIEAIKAAMVSGPNGIATHSGHWYNCVNGHPVRLATLQILGNTDFRLVVCNRRMRHAHGACSMSKMRRGSRRTESRSSRRGEPSKRDGIELIRAKISILIALMPHASCNIHVCSQDW